MSKQTDLIRKQLDKIYTNTQQVSESFGRQAIAISTLKMILNKNKLPLNGELKEFNKKWNKLIGTLYSACNKIAESRADKDVPLNVLKLYINMIKDNLDKQ